MRKLECNSQSNAIFARRRGQGDNDLDSAADDEMLLDSVAAADIAAISYVHDHE